MPRRSALGRTPPPATPERASAGVSPGRRAPRRQPAGPTGVPATGCRDRGRGRRHRRAGWSATGARRVRQAPSEPRARHRGSPPRVPVRRRAAHGPPPRPRTGWRARPGRRTPSSGRAQPPGAPVSRRRSCGPVRRTAGPAACPARTRTGRPRPRRAPPGSTRPDHPQPGSGWPPRHTGVPRSLPGRPREQRRHGRGDHRPWASASPHFIVGFPGTPGTGQGRISCTASACSRCLASSQSPVQ